MVSWSSLPEGFIPPCALDVRRDPGQHRAGLPFTVSWSMQYDTALVARKSGRASRRDIHFLQDSFTFLLTPLNNPAILAAFFNQSLTFAVAQSRVTSYLDRPQGHIATRPFPAFLFSRWRRVNGYFSYLNHDRPQGHIRSRLFLVNLSFSLLGGVGNQFLNANEVVVGSSPTIAARPCSSAG